ncbi:MULTISPECIES: DUF3572 domain-containing protein [Alphaproteobacteria]|uniref:DUF3572 domain-containing protein n=2 Tax=Alphaproteobacteria TaxID=28211 RepID=A0A512HLS9_9HYPH|nr:MULTISPECIES: DUF3572 domain-containing protein [Alphaproteobacteria]GEO86404.1 hypothetical protein RNA01_33360 [Ciceribacter naphthalenivorans]GLR22282.1 hypothetical protein GCM10007920_20690 [Ciceribacter naphthalenivorans]GLT05138.1 hypothetical protein GCM10007926_20690 [Sphingomonas psychrolutea]
MKNSSIPASADETAIAVLGWLANEPDMLGRFLALSGTRPDQLRQSIRDPAFMAGMLDFLMAHEPTLMAFCSATDIEPEAVVNAAHHYTGPTLGSGEY